MTRILVLGSIVAVGGGGLLGFALAYQVVPLTVLAVLIGLAGTFVVVRAVPEPTPDVRVPVTLSGHLVRPVKEEPQVVQPIQAAVQQLPASTVASVADAA